MGILLPQHGQKTLHWAVMELNVAPSGIFNTKQQTACVQNSCSPAFVDTSLNFGTSSRARIEKCQLLHDGAFVNKTSKLQDQKVKSTLWIWVFSPFVHLCYNIYPEKHNRHPRWRDWHTVFLMIEWAELVLATNGTQWAQKSCQPLILSVCVGDGILQSKLKSHRKYLVLEVFRNQTN